MTVRPAGCDASHKEDYMDNQELRALKEKLGIINYKIAYKTGVHLNVIEDFFSGKTEDLGAKDRERIEALLLKEAKKA